ncbi:MAG TPA: hypothetical protein DHN33_11830 [Eubacteriaceae bacterium]|nr:hypothetical protein [Eubacteriaceae bacterium]
MDVSLESNFGTKEDGMMKARKWKMKYSVKEITSIGLVAALIAVIGFVFYFIGSLFPVPGYKFVVFAPFLSFMLFIPVYKIKKTGVIAAISSVFALIMASITIFMSIAIFLTGICTEVLAFVLFRRYDTPLRTMLAVSIYPVFAVLWAFFVADYFTGNALYQLSGGGLFLVVLCGVIYAFGFVGANISYKVVYKRLEKAEEMN